MNESKAIGQRLRAYPVSAMWNQRSWYYLFVVQLFMFAILLLILPLHIPVSLHHILLEVQALSIWKQCIMLLVKKNDWWKQNLRKYAVLFTSIVWCLQLHMRRFSGDILLNLLEIIWCTELIFHQLSTSSKSLSTVFYLFVSYKCDLILQIPILTK